MTGRKRERFPKAGRWIPKRAGDLLKIVDKRPELWMARRLPCRCHLKCMDTFRKDGRFRDVNLLGWAIEIARPCIVNELPL
jgi:hypothetical protein